MRPLLLQERYLGVEDCYDGDRLCPDCLASAEAEGLRLSIAGIDRDGPILRIAYSLGFPKDDHPVWGLEQAVGLGLVYYDAQGMKIEGVQEEPVAFDLEFVREQVGQRSGEIEVTPPGDAHYVVIMFAAGLKTEKIPLPPTKRFQFLPPRRQVQ